MERVAAMLVFGAIVLGGMGLIAVMLRGRQRMQELAIRERIALIEKGLVPSPEADPARFESLIGLRRATSSRGARFQSAGVMLMGLGCALAVLLSFGVHLVSIGVGVGGGLAVLGLAVFVNGSLLSDGRPPDTPSA
jgi:hypothetical protein